MLVPTALALPPRVASDYGGIITDTVESEHYGTFNGIVYVMHKGRFDGLASGAYDVPFEIIAPEDPDQGNGITIVEPFHPLGGAGGLKGYLTPEFLFQRGFSHAGIGYPDVEDPMAWYLEDDPIEILNNYALWLREDDAARDMVGDLDWLYGVGVSRVTVPMLALLASPDAGVLDFSFLFVPSWEQDTYSQHPSSNNIMVFLTEWDLVNSARWPLVHTDALRGSSATYRSYEVAGGPHVPDIPWIREICMEAYGITSEGTTPLEWTPVARALFLAGHRWTTEGTEPPPSAYLAESRKKGKRDPVYWEEFGLKLKTRIARDDNGNALGGIRLPDLEIGRGQYIALDPGSFFGFGLFGTWKDLQCVPLPDGSPRFRNHRSYVRQFARHARKLVRQGYLLPKDAWRLIIEAARSDVGKPCIDAPISP
jgi:hypothetical protein